MHKNNVLPPSKLNEHELLVIGMDGGRVQNRSKNQDDSHWYHASEHLCDVAKAVYPNEGSRQAELWAGLKSLLWKGKFDVLMDGLRSLGETAGRAPAVCMETDPRKVLSRNVGYFDRHRARMDYPRYRRNGWPTGSGVVESGMKLFNKRVKGTEQFRSTPGVESAMALRAGWLSEETEFYHQLYARPNKWAA